MEEMTEIGSIKKQEKAKTIIIETLKDLMISE
jgi:hypothetical protein